MTCWSMMIVIGCGYDLPGMPYPCWNIIQYLQESNSLEKQEELSTRTPKAGGAIQSNVTTNVKSLPV